MILLRAAAAHRSVRLHTTNDSDVDVDDDDDNDYNLTCLYVYGHCRTYPLRRA